MRSSSECLDSHGIVIDPEKKTLTIQSSATKQDFVYDLTEEEVKKLTSNSIKEVPLQQRLDLLNEVIKGDFSEKITLDMLNSKEQVNIKLLPEVESRTECTVRHGASATGHQYSA
jgi:hypothetical protein